MFVFVCFFVGFVTTDVWPSVNGPRNMKSVIKRWYCPGTGALLKKAYQGKRGKGREGGGGSLVCVVRPQHRCLPGKRHTSTSQQRSQSIVINHRIDSSETSSKGCNEGYAKITHTEIYHQELHINSESVSEMNICCQNLHFFS